MTRPTTETPSISVIIPTFNRASMVCDCVASVLATGYPALEVIVVDDCSPDDTGERIASRFGDDARVRYMRNERNSFQAVSRNRGAAAATGDHLLFLDDDNIVHPDILRELEAVYTMHPEMGLVAPMAIHKRRGGDQFGRSEATSTAGRPVHATVAPTSRLPTSTLIQVRMTPPSRRHTTRMDSWCLAAYSTWWAVSTSRMCRSSRSPTSDGG